MAIVDDESINVGYAKLTVTKLGEVSFGGSQISDVDWPGVKYIDQSKDSICVS